ncbi:hypothetical protein KUTeg_013200 [Tegillarca granosa]|uniref:Protein kinase domain-containing protein n=1 Tax=Tegillarca granosa TaxID=220873 RepID=A0ABQ9EVF5_TEGGR|nr:hypothetical protein KUTeg_013200 [Tegillarca granosa]
MAFLLYQIGKCPFGKRWEITPSVEAPHTAHQKSCRKKTYNAFAVDVWSMGVILYAMVNGGFPFEASNIHQMVECQLIKEMPVSKVTVSQCLAIIERMLEPEVEKRATIEEIMNSQFFKN